MVKNGPKGCFLHLLKIFIFTFFWNQSKMTNYLTIDIAQIPYLENLVSWIMVQNALGQSNCMILQIVITYKVSVRWSLFFLHEIKIKSFLQVDTNVLCEHSQVCPDNQSNCRIHKRAISQKRHEGLPWFFIT